MENTWFLYLLRCKGGTLYCGITTDIQKRFQGHISGKGAKYTRGRTPLELVYQEECTDHSAALRREIEVKKMTKKEKERMASLWNESRKKDE